MIGPISRILVRYVAGYLAVRLLIPQSIADTIGHRGCCRLRSDGAGRRLVLAGEASGVEDMTFLMSILGWLTSGPLDRIFKTIDTSIDNETERQRVKADLVKSYLSAQVSVLTGRGWWFPLLFLIPAGFWFASVCVYSVLFCKGCYYPQTWTVAALPPPLDQWMGAIVGSLFIGKAGGDLIARLRK